MTVDAVAAHEWFLDADGRVRATPKPVLRIVKSEATPKPAPKRTPREDRGLIHGKYYTYVRHKCRCDECREASAAYERSRYERKNELRRGVPRKPPTPEQRERKNAQQRAKRKLQPDKPRVLTPEQKARHNQRKRERRAEMRNNGE